MIEHGLCFASTVAYYLGKKVPARNIIGKVIMFPIIPAVSGFLVIVPTIIPNEEKSIDARVK